MRRPQPRRAAESWIAGERMAVETDRRCQRPGSQGFELGSWLGCRQRRAAIPMPWLVEEFDHSLGAKVHNRALVYTAMRQIEGHHAHQNLVAGMRLQLLALEYLLVAVVARPQEADHKTE